MVRQQIQAFPDAGEHAQRQYIHLEDTQGLDIVLVPLDERAIRHGAIADGNSLRQRPVGEDETAHML